MKNKSIFVTQPSLPNLEEFVPYLERIWESKKLTNNGQFHQELESRLCDYLNVKYISLFSNGTLALIAALQALNVKGDVITTPYSFVATSHSLLWNSNKPIFVDIDPHTLNISPDEIEKAITPQTTAIMPVHCYGNPCDVEKIQAIASSRNLKVIYDAAHAFAVKDHGQSILNFGDLSVLSFHATKVFNTFEGGAIVSQDLNTKRRIDSLKNFGFVDEITVVDSGINGKMSEINAAFGLLQLKDIDSLIEQRSKLDNFYRSHLADVRGIRCLPQFAEKPNYSYFPIMVGIDYPLNRDELYDRLKEEGINGRRYFYPLISEFPMYRDFPSSNFGNLPNAYKAAKEVICLPIYPGLLEADQSRIIGIIRDLGRA